MMDSSWVRLDAPDHTGEDVAELELAPLAPAEHVAGEDALYPLGVHADNQRPK